MVKVARPPLDLPEPEWFFLPGGFEMHRAWLQDDPNAPGAGATTFRYYGPLHRFDHQTGTRKSLKRRTIKPPFIMPADTPDRGILYCGATPDCALVEVFGATGIIKRAGRNISKIVLPREIPMLDLRGSSAMCNGVPAAIGAIEDYARTQEWARYFYEDTAFGGFFGLCYHGAYNNEDAFAFFERSEPLLAGASIVTQSLTDPSLHCDLNRIAKRHKLELI